MKKTISLFLTINIILSLFMSAASAEKSFSIVFSAEGLTLGQGFYAEPEEYSLDKINSLLAKQGLGPYTKETLSASAASLAFFADKNMEIKTSGSTDNNFYLKAIKGIDKGKTAIPPVITEKSGISDRENDGQDDEWLGEFDYSSFSGWTISVDNILTDRGASDIFPGKNGGTHTIRWHFSLYGYGGDTGCENPGGDMMFRGADRSSLYISYARAGEKAQSRALPYMEKLVMTDEDIKKAESTLNRKEEPLSQKPQESTTEAETETEAPEKKESLEDVYKNTLLSLKNRVKEPSFGTINGEWTVFTLAKSELFTEDREYFDSYYKRIAETVKETADGKGRLHQKKSTENSRLALALLSIGKNPRDVEGRDILSCLRDISYTSYQGINGVIFALAALEGADSDSASKKQYTDFILKSQLADGGFSQTGEKADPDITAMALISLSFSDDREDVKKAAERAVSCLSAMQNSEGGFSSGGRENAESVSQVICGLTAWGINPKTDGRFIKNGRSPLDALLSFYNSETKDFSHTRGGKPDAMATDQAAMAMTAFMRLINGKAPLYEKGKVTAESIASPSFDVNLDGKINALDAVLLLKGEEGDFNNDGKTDIEDALAVKKYFVEGTKEAA